MKLVLEEERCVGHGRCYELAPDLFAEDDVGRCVILHSRVPPELEDAARLGEANCPERAIRVESD